MNGSRKDRAGTTIGAVVALVALAVGLVVALGLGNAIDSDTTPLIISLLGFISTTVLSLLALARIEDTKRDLNNGAVSKPVKEAVEEAFSASERPTVERAVRKALAEILEEHLPDDNDSAAPPVLRVERKERRNGR